MSQIYFISFRKESLQQLKAAINKIPNNKVYILVHFLHLRDDITYEKIKKNIHIYFELVACIDFIKSWNQKHKSENKIIIMSPKTIKEFYDISFIPYYQLMNYSTGPNGPTCSTEPTGSSGPIGPTSSTGPNGPIGPTGPGNIQFNSTEDIKKSIYSYFNDRPGTVMFLNGLTLGYPDNVKMFIISRCVCSNDNSKNMICGKIIKKSIEENIKPDDNEKSKYPTYEIIFF